MSDGLNRVILFGNLGQEPDLRYTPAGLPVLNLRLATNESYVDRNKEVQQRTEWHSIVVFGARAEGLARILFKGATVLVEGGLRTSSYEKDGAKRYKTDVVAREVCLSGRRMPATQHDDEPLPVSAAGPAGMDDDGAPASAEARETGGGRSAEAPAPERSPRNGEAPEPEKERPHRGGDAAPPEKERAPRNGKGSRAPAQAGRIFVDELPF